MRIHLDRWFQFALVQLAVMTAVAFLFFFALDLSPIEAVSIIWFGTTAYLFGYRDGRKDPHDRP